MTTRKLIVEVVDAHDLLPKDGQGTSSPYVIIDFDGQRKRTKTIFRDLNPIWNEKLEFLVADPITMATEVLEAEIYNDKRSGTNRRNHFLGRVRICGSQFARKGDEAIIHFQLEKKSIFSWIRGELGLRVYYIDEPNPPDETNPPPDETQPDKPPENPPPPPAEQPPPAESNPLEGSFPLPTEMAQEAQHQQSNAVEENPLPDPPENPPAEQLIHPEIPTNSPPAVSNFRSSASAERVRTRRTRGEYALKTLIEPFPNETDLFPAYDLVEPMQYLFVKIVKARSLTDGAIEPFVKIRVGSHYMRSKTAMNRPGHGNFSGQPEWNQVFAFGRDRLDSGNGSTLEISVWSADDTFLGGVLFDLSDVPVRDPPDSPLAPQWYRLEGDGSVTGDLMLSVWIGTQADDSFPESYNSDAPYLIHTRSKVYHSPKLWYLRLSVIEAQDLQLNLPSSHSPRFSDIRVRAQLGFQALRTRPSRSAHNSIYWHEDLIFVAGEPLEEQLILLVEDRTTKEPSLLGHALIPLTTVAQRFDDRQVAAKWYGLSGGGSETGEGAGYCGRVHLRLCLEGGYHVLDEAAHVCSDFRPTAKELWKPAIGILELGVLGGRGLLPMKTKGGGKSATDAYCVAKYGKKWVRTRTITDSFDPRWNEQYTWQVYDPCTVLTIGVFDNWRMFADMAEEKPDYRIGKVRIRVSTLESNRVYTNSYPLLVLLRSGVKKMGEIELAVRFTCSSWPDTCGVYGQPLLPRMHYLHPLGVTQQDALRGAAMKMVAAWLGRSEPPLGPEVVQYMLDTDSHVWSMRRSKANWFRIMSVLAWAVGLARWIDDICRWRNPVTTVLVHVLFLVLVWYPDLIIPTGFFYVFLIGAWYYRFRPKIPAGMDIRLSQADTVEADELDEEFDGVPSTKPPELVRIRYDRLRTLAARIQTILGDFATQGERIQALISWRDPRATRLFIGTCLAVAMVLYVVPAKMVAVAVGFYLLRHPMFRDPMPPAGLNFFRRLPSLSDRMI